MGKSQTSALPYWPPSVNTFFCRSLISLNSTEGACRKLIQVEVEGRASQKRETKRGLYELCIHVSNSRLAITFLFLVFYQSIVESPEICTPAQNGRLFMVGGIGRWGARITDMVWTSSEGIPLVHTETENSHWLKVDKSVITLTTTLSLHSSISGI